MGAVKIRTNDFDGWRRRVIARMRALEIRAPLDEEELRDGHSVGDTPAEFCAAVFELPLARDSIG